jgi:hypothetical protein
LPQDALLGALRLFIAGLGQRSRLLGSLDSRVTAVLLQELTIRPLNTRQRSSNFAADARIGRFLRGAQPHIVGRFGLLTRTQSSHRSKIKGARISGAGLDDLRQELLGFSALPREVGVDAAAVQLGHLGGALREQPRRGQREESGERRTNSNQRARIPKAFHSMAAPKAGGMSLSDRTRRRADFQSRSLPNKMVIGVKEESFPRSSN